jgi:lysophospholipase L1-like esterase
MIACAILGDSLAAGVALYRHDCVADTKMGITSSVYAAALTMTFNADTVLISLGINDGIPDRQTPAHLVRLRVGVHAGRVYWVLPARPEVTRRLVRAIAQLCSDRLIETKGYTGADGLHLSGQAYREIGEVFDVP